MVRNTQFREVLLGKLSLFEYESQGGKGEEVSAASKGD